ncbi:hypothetical protein [Ensifer sp. Root127]|uniref:hypothetical protein n=1 Tax=Ensifer sp. Root127 TaxID=1736440 RepID=UPI000A98270D|nr:hypothetical protein [Ensifer sp. Root127]
MEHTTVATTHFVFIMTPTAHTMDITDDTAARAITTTVDRQSSLSRVPMGESLEPIRAASPVGFTLICVPADMSASGEIKGKLPSEQFTKERQISGIMFPPRRTHANASSSSARRKTATASRYKCRTLRNMLRPRWR